MSKRSITKILLKYSGEAVAGDKDQGIDPIIVHYMSGEIKKVVNKKISVGLVIGGGNLFRGEELNQDGIDRVAGDHMGMLATVMNGIALRDSLERIGVKTRVMSAIPMPGIVEHYDRTTDTAACLRAIEINADLMIKATKVDGVYSEDPEVNPNANFFPLLKFDEAISKNLKIMDTTALTLARHNNMDIKVFNFKKEDALLKIVNGDNLGTLISNG